MRSCLALCFLLICLASSSSVSRGQLSSSFYSTTCPSLPDVVLAGVTEAVLWDPRSAASLLRLFFHDCFVNGCDASVLLDDTATFTGEKSAAPNADSLRGFDVIDDIKSAVEVACPSTVSCADILALAARDSVVLLGGPSWTVVLGRNDATTASIDAANSDLPGPASSLSQLIEGFADKGLNARDMTALSGAHTFGRARCVNFRSHIYNDDDIDPDFAAALQETCPASGDDSTLSPLDAQTPDAFDNSYYQNLVAQQGLLHSDQELYNGGTQDVLVQQYAEDDLAFFNDFAAAMEKMGNISPLTGTSGEIRLNCRAVN